MAEQYRIGIIGGGSWATALAKIVLSTQSSISWCLRSSEHIEAFRTSGHNPKYLTQVPFPIERINFYSESDINDFVRSVDVVILAVPSPYVRAYLKRIRNSVLRDRIVINAIKGMIPDENLLISDYLHKIKDMPRNQIGVISGPCHAEEIAHNGRSYLTLGCFDLALAEHLRNAFSNDYVHCAISKDVTGIEYASVLKNIYAIAAGICNGLQYGDNFQSVLISNAIAEMSQFVSSIHLINRNVTESVYLGDLLVTAYSDYSRNRTFGKLVGSGLSVRDAQEQMKMVAEGYYGCKCIAKVNESYQVNMPIAYTVYEILYKGTDIRSSIDKLSKKFK